MKLTIGERIEIIKNTMHRVAGIKVDVTLNLKGGTTISFEGENDLAANKIIKYFNSCCTFVKDITYDYDKECDQTCIYIKYH